MRPATVADVLVAAKGWLDTADRAVGVIAEMRGVPNPAQGKSVQGDLLLLAAWLREHPDVDAAMYACLSAVDVL